MGVSETGDNLIESSLCEPVYRCSLPKQINVLSGEFSTDLADIFSVALHNYAQDTC